jgi:hypothetical protein
MKVINLRCGSIVIISGFGGLKFRGVIFDGFKPRPTFYTIMG